MRSFVEERKEWYEERKKKNALVSKSSSTSQSPRGSIDEKDFADGELVDNISTSSEHEELDNDELTEYICSESSQVIINKDTEGKTVTEPKEGVESITADKSAVVSEGLVAMNEIEVIDPSEVDRLVPLSEPVTGGKANARQRLLKFLKSSSFSSVEEAQRKELLQKKSRRRLKWAKSN